MTAGTHIRWIYAKRVEAVGLGREAGGLAKHFAEITDAAKAAGFRYFAQTGIRTAHQQKLGIPNNYFAQPVIRYNTRLGKRCNYVKAVLHIG